MEIELNIDNKITWENGKEGNTPLTAVNLNSVNPGTVTALTNLKSKVETEVSVIEGEISDVKTDSDNTYDKMVRVRTTASDCYGIAFATQQMLDSHYLKVVEEIPTSPDAITIYFITEA